MSLSELEKNYTPSEWSKRYPAAELLEKFFNFSESVTSQARRSIKHDLNVPYGANKKMKYDLYGTDLPRDAPIFVFIHGGYWQEFSKDLAGFSVNVLVSRGIKVIIAGYDLCPQVTLTDIVSEIQDMAHHVLKLASQWGSKCVWIAGHSAGAHLAVSLLYSADWLSGIERAGYAGILKGFVLISGVFDLEPILTASFNDALKLTSKEVAKFSFAPIGHPHPRDSQGPLSGVKVLVTVGDCDSPVFVEESRRMAKRLISFVDDVEFLLLRDIDHFDIVERLTEPDFGLTKAILENIAAK